MGSCFGRDLSRIRIPFWLPGGWYMNRKKEHIGLAASGETGPVRTLNAPRIRNSLAPCLPVFFPRRELNMLCQSQHKSEPVRSARPYSSSRFSRHFLSYGSQTPAPDVPRSVPYVTAMSMEDLNESQVDLSVSIARKKSGQNARPADFVITQEDIRNVWEPPAFPEALATGTGLEGRGIDRTSGPSVARISTGVRQQLLVWG